MNFHENVIFMNGPMGSDRRTNEHVHRGKPVRETTFFGVSPAGNNFYYSDLAPFWNPV